MYDFRLLFTGVVENGKLRTFQKVVAVRAGWKEDMEEAKADFAEEVLWDAFQEDKEDAPELYAEILKDMDDDTPDYVPEELFRMYA